MGDGECNEGCAAMQSKLNNLQLIINKNFQQTGSNLEIMSLEDLSAKWTSFGWDVKLTVIIQNKKIF